MFQILILKNPALKRGLKPIQRLAYLSSMTFWFFPLPRLLFMVAPLLHIFLDVKIFVSNVDEAIAYTATYIVVNMMLQNYLYGSVRWPWISELYEYVQGVFLAKAIVAVALSPRKPTFNVTAKGLSLENDHLSELAWPYFAIYGLLMAGGLTAAYRYMFEPGVTDLMLVVGLWNTFNMVIAGVALGCVAERRQPDRHPRLRVDRQGTLTLDGAAIPVVVENVSAGGCALRFPAADAPALEPGRTQGRLAVVPVGTRMGDATLPVALKHLATRGEDVIGGFEFDGIEPRDYYALADLMYGDADALGRFLASRRTHKDLFRGSAQFLRWSVTEPIRAVGYLLKGASPQAAAPPVSEAPTVQPAPAAVPETAAPEVALDTVVAAPEPAVQTTPPAVAAEADPAPAEPTPETASGAAMPADWLNQLLDMAHWELRNAENANQAAREPDHSDDQEAAKVSRAA